jgi:hypothetical protein
VFSEGRLVGMQEMVAVDFPYLRTVNSASWLGLPHQGRGIGKEMRAAILQLAFVGIGALRAESDAFHDNDRSNGVSCSLGYEPNGTVIARRPSGGAMMDRHLLTREAWEPRRRDDIEIDGLSPCLECVWASGGRSRLDSVRSEPTVGTRLVRGVKPSCSFRYRVRQPNEDLSQTLLVSRRATTHGSSVFAAAGTIPAVAKVSNRVSDTSSGT